MRFSVYLWLTAVVLGQHIVAVPLIRPHAIASIEVAFTAMQRAEPVVLPRASKKTTKKVAAKPAAKTTGKKKVTTIKPGPRRTEFQLVNIQAYIQDGVLLLVDGDGNIHDSVKDLSIVVAATGSKEQVIAFKETAKHS